jgi:hypothetical protein
VHPDENGLPLFSVYTDYASHFITVIQQTRNCFQATQYEKLASEQYHFAWISQLFQNSPIDSVE